MINDALIKEVDVSDIPEEHQKLVMHRFDQVRQDPDRLLDWDKAKKKLESSMNGNNLASI